MFLRMVCAYGAHIQWFIFPDHYSLTVTIDSPEDAATVRNYEMECLIDALLSCQEAVYPTIKKQFQYNMEDAQYKVYVSVLFLYNQ